MRFVALLVAAVIAVIAAVAALKFSGSDNTSPQTQTTIKTQPVSTVDIWVARKVINMGEVFKDDMVDRQPWPSHLLLDGFITTESPDANIKGKVARSSFQMGEPIIRSKIANPNDPSFLAAALPAGMRAVTIATDAISGVAGYIFPGDRVDVVITHNIPSDIKARTDTRMRPISKPDVSEVLIANVRVLAVNVRQAAGKEVTSSPSSLTLEVKEEDVQALRLGEKIGSLSLALRPLKENDGDGATPTRSIYLTNVKVLNSYQGGVRIIRGAGGDNDSKGAAFQAMRDNNQQIDAIGSDAAGAQ